MPPTRTPLILAAMLLLATPVALMARTDKLTPLYTQMDAASQRYQEAQVALRKGDDTAMAAMAKALDDIEELANQCFKQRGCDVTKVTTTFKVLLKEHDLGPQETVQGEDVPATEDVSPVLANSAEAQQSMELLDQGNEFDSMVEMNEPVQAAIRDWLTSQRAYLIDAWENYQYMRYLMWPEYEKAGLPEALLFGIMAKESGGKVHAVSKSGASGPLQFMYGTGSRFGLARDETGFDSRFDPQMAARANAAYINERFAELNKNIEYTVAAYNGGEGRAARLYASSGGQSFWSPTVYAQLPPETRDYVPAVIAAAWLFLHPKKYGLDFPKIDTTPDQFSLVRDSSINELTICLGNGGGSRDGWFRVLRNLNPRYEPGTNIPAGTVLRAPKRITAQYQSQCVQGPRAELAAELMHATKPVVASLYVPPSSSRSSRKNSSHKPHEYRVRSGDNLIEIARDHSCDLTVLARKNKIKGPDYRIRLGQRLKLIGCEG